MDWLEDLPEDLKSNTELVESWKGKTPVDVLKSHIELDGKVKTLSESGIFPLGENPTDEEKTAYEGKVRKLLGVPEKIEDYKLELPENIPADDPVIQALVQTGHANGMNAVQVQQVVNAGIKAIMESREAQKLVNRESVQKLWGSQFDSNLADAVKSIEAVGKEAGLSEDEMKVLSTELPSHPALIRMFQTISRHYKEDGMKGDPASSDSMSVAEKLFPKEKMGKYA